MAQKPEVNIILTTLNLLLCISLLQNTSFLFDEHTVKMSTDNLLQIGR